SDTALVAVALGPRFPVAAGAGRDGLADRPPTQHAVGHGYPVHRGRLLLPRRTDGAAALPRDALLLVRAGNSVNVRFLCPACETSASAQPLAPSWCCPGCGHLVAIADPPCSTSPEGITLRACAVCGNAELYKMKG